MHTKAHEIDLTCDGHIHTRLCHHATGEMEEYVLAGIRKGLRKIVFLEHLETGIDYFKATWLTEDDFDYYFTEGLRLREKYADKIEVSMGVELGYNPECSDAILARVVSRQWDRIGISYHFARLPGVSDHLNLLSRKPVNITIANRIGIDRILGIYFATLKEAVLRMPGTVLCHLDAALRFTPNLTFTAQHLEQIDALLEAVKQRDMALEINTSGIPIRGEPFPAQAILKMALNYGIPLVAGSDAHTPHDVGRHFEDVPAYISSAASS